MPKEQQKRSIRQQPISCRSCRSRKLRCNRELPCSNCVSRGVSCELEKNITQPPRSVSSFESELLERVRNLERQAENQKLCPNEVVTPLPGQETPLEQVHSSTVSPETITHEATTPAFQTLNSAIADLESIYSENERLVTLLISSSIVITNILQQDKILSNSLVIRNRPIEQITNAPAFINRSTISFEPFRCIWLPHYSEAKILVEKYVQDVDYIHHIVYTPSLFSSRFQVERSPGA